jgi:hypothetical protein
VTWVWRALRQGELETNLCLTLLVLHPSA